MARKNYKKKNLLKTTESMITTNRYLNIICKEDFILSTNCTFCPNVFCFEEKLLLKFTEELEEIYEQRCINVGGKIHSMLLEQRDRLKCFAKQHNTSIKIPPTPLRGRNISQIGIIKQRITERLEYLQKRNSFLKDKVNPTGVTNTHSLQSLNEINSCKNDNNINSPISQRDIHFSNCPGQKRKNQPEMVMNIEEQTKTLVDAELRRKFLLAEKVKRIKSEREEKVKQVQEKLLKQRMNLKKMSNNLPINEKKYILINRGVIETSKQNKLPLLAYKNTKCFNNKQLNNEKVPSLSSNKLTNFVDFKKPIVFYKDRNTTRKRKSNMIENAKISFPPMKSKRCLEMKSSVMLVKKSNMTENNPTNNIKFNRNSTKFTNVIDNESYKVENMSNFDTTDDENDPLGIVPNWAHPKNLKTSLIYQSGKFKSLKNIEELFAKFRFLKMVFSSNESNI
uniref:INCENP_ARK-bind domain-containing protein n=1 Tax=Strongyloides venezuelensis TaxID=75913 RepID=A0A0K0F8L5_STRVS